MTIIITLKNKNEIYLAADKQVTGGNLKKTLPQPKYFKKPFTITPNILEDTTDKDHTEYLIIAYAGDIGIINHLQYGFKLPDKIETDTFETYLHLDLLPALQEHYTALNLRPPSEEYELDFNLLLIYKGHVYEIFSDYTAIEYDSDYHCIGCANEIAQGSLYSTIGEDPEYRINIAMQACAHESNAVSTNYDTTIITNKTYKEE